jgi:hypothetical protein
VGRPTQRRRIDGACFRSRGNNQLSNHPLTAAQSTLEIHSCLCVLFKCGALMLTAVAVNSLSAAVADAPVSNAKPVGTLSASSPWPRYRAKLD